MGCCASSPSDQVVVDPQATKLSLVDETAAAATAEKTKKEAEEKEAKMKIDKENKKKEEDAKNAKKKESLPESSAAKTGDDKSDNNKNDDNNNNNNNKTSSEDKYTKFTFNENGDAIDENGNLLRVTTKAAREALKKGISALEHFEEEKSNPRQRSDTKTANGDNAEGDDDQAEGLDKLVSRELTQRAQALIMQSHDLKDRYDEHLVRKIREGGQMGTFDTTTTTNSDNATTNVDEDNKTNILLQKQRNQIEQDKNLTDEERKQKLDELSKKEKRKRRNSAIFPEMVIGDHFSPIVRRVGEVLIEATKENEKLPQEEGKNDDDQQQGDKPAANDNDGNAQSKSKTSSKKSSLQLSNEDRKRKLDIAADLIAASIAQFEDLEMKLNLAEKQQQRKTSTAITIKNEKFDDKKLILDEKTGKKYYIDQNSGQKIFVDLEKNTKNNNNNGTKKSRGENDDDDDELYDLYYDDEGNPYFLDPKTGNRVYTDDEKKEILVDDGGNCYYLDDDGLRVYTNGCKRDEDGKHYYISKAGEKVYTNVDTIDRSAATPKNKSKQRELNPQQLLVDEKTKKEYFLDEKGNKVFPNVTKDEKTGKKSFVDERTGKKILVDDDKNQENKTNSKKLLVDEKTGKEYYIDEQTGEKVFPNQFFTDAETKKKYFLDKQGKKVFVESSDKNNNNNNNTDSSNAITKKTETTTVDSNGRKILTDEKTGKQYYSDQNGTKVFPTIKSDAKDGANKYFIDPKSGKKVLLVTTTTTTTTEDKNGNNNNNKENFVSSPNGNNINNGKNITSPAAKAAAAKFNASPPSSPTKTANGKKSVPPANKTTSHSPVRLNQLAAESPSPNTNNNNGSKFDRNLIIDYSDADDNDADVDVDNKNKNKSVNNNNSRNKNSVNNNNNNTKNTAMITKNANRKVSFPSDAILRALNGPSFFELASDQPRGSCFVADEALLHCLIHEKKRNQNQEHEENENTTTVSENNNNNYILSTVAKCVDRFKKILFNAKVARLMNDDRGGDASRTSNAEEKEQQPSSPGLLSFGKNILGVGNLVGRGGDSKKNFKGNNSCNSLESATNNSGAAASASSGPVDDQAPESVIKVKKLLKEFSKNPNPGSDISIQLQRALQDCRKDIESRSASNSADEEKRFIDRILVHNEKIFEMLMMTQPSQQQNDASESNNDRKNDNDKKLSQLVDTMSSKISDVDPAPISSMTESEKEKVVNQVNNSIDEVIYNIENISENNVSSFSPREGEDSSFQNNNNKNIVEGLVAVQEIIRDSVKWFSNENKSQSIKRMLSFKNNNNNNTAKSPSSPNSNMNNINNNRATSPANSKTGNFKPPQQRDALNDNVGKTKSPTSTTANKPASSNNNSPILAGRRSNNNNNNMSNGNSPTKKSLLQELKDNHDKNPSSRNSSVARGKSPPPALKTSATATSGPTSHPYLQQQLKNKNNINTTNKKSKHDSGSNKIFRPRSPTTNNIIASTFATNGNENDHFRLDDRNHNNNSSHHDNTLSYSALSVLPVEALSADQRKAILQSDQTLLKAVGFRISTLTPQQKQHTAQALNKSAEVMDMLKKQIMNYSSQHHQQQQQQNNHNGNESTTAGSRFSRINNDSSKSIPELDKVRAILNEVHLGTRNSSSSSDELTPQEQFALAREVIENMQNELDSKLDPANHSNNDIQQKRRDEVTNVLLNHYSDALQLMEQASFSSNASAELAIVTNNNNHTHNLAPHPGTATAAAIASLNETLEELRKMVAAKILNTNNNSDSEQQFCDLPVQERTKLVAQAKALIAVGMKKLSPLGVEEQRNILPVFDAITNLLRSVASSASAVALQKQILDGGGANGNPNPINHFSPLLPPAKHNNGGNEATGGAAAGNVLAGRRANNNTSSTNSTPNKLNGIQDTSFGRDSENQNSINTNNNSKAKSMHLMNNTNNELRSSSNNNNNNNLHGRRAASFSNTNNANSNISKAKSTILPPRTQKKQGHHIPEMVYTEGDIEESVFSRFVAPVGRIDRFGIGKVNCDLCVEFPSGIARVVVHDSNFSDWSRIKGNALLGQISKAAQDFAAHGGLMQYRTANMVYSESPSRDDTIHTAAEVENEQLKSLNMLQFEKWDWRKAK